VTDNEPDAIAGADLKTPHSADADPPQPSGAAPVSKRAHRVLVPVMLVLAM
jgi:hypothetical protein